MVGYCLLYSRQYEIYNFYLSSIVLIHCTSAFGHKLYCSSESLTETLKNPTMYCTVQGQCNIYVKVFFNTYVYVYTASLTSIGALTQYFTVCALLWWLFHTAFISYKIIWPIHAKSHQKYFKWVHFGFASIGKVLNNLSN